jgi:hypothetical protein
MKTSVSILFCLMLIVIAGMVQAAPFGTYDSYGIWYDRDGVDSSQAAAWGAVNGGTYNTGGIYNVVINYHAVDANTVTMFATINGIQQGFWNTTPHAAAEPDIYPAGLSFTTGDYNTNGISDITEMQVFTALWGTSTTKSGTALFTNMQATGTTGSGIYTTKNMGPVTYSGLPTYPANLITMLDGKWNLTATDLILSYTADFSLLTGPSTDPDIVFAVGLEAYGLNRKTPPGGGWMGNVVENSTANNGSLNYNDKFDLQNGWGDETNYNVTAVPEPSTLILLASGLIGLVGYGRKKFFKR